MPGHSKISVARQCELLGLSRSSYYYEPQPESPENLLIMAALDKQYTDTPFYGVIKLQEALERSLKIRINHKRIRRLKLLMGLTTIYPKGRNTSKPNKEHEIYPYLLRNVEITHPDHVWSTDITYIGLKHGFMYLTAIMDWYSRYVIAWGLSNSLESSESVETLKKALQTGKPAIFNSDQGSQFTSHKFLAPLKAENISISMDGKGRAFDNIFIERLWRTVKYEHVYLHAFENGYDLYKSLEEYFNFYNYERFHQSLGYKTPFEIYQENRRKEN